MVGETNRWDRCVRELQAELPEDQFNTWIRPLQADENAETLRLLAPNRFVVDWLNQHYVERIRSILERHNQSASFVIEVGSRPVATEEATPVRRPPPATAGESTPVQPVSSRLNQGFTFETFVEGKSNQLARAAASQVGENPGQSYNPLFIYGGVGLGKTHLMHAVGNAILAAKPSARVAYVHSERFVGDMVRGLQHNRISEFKRLYRSLDA